MQTFFNVNTKDETFTCRVAVTMVWNAGDVPPIPGESLEDTVMHLVGGLDDVDEDWRPDWLPEFGFEVRCYRLSVLIHDPTMSS